MFKVVCKVALSMSSVNKDVRVESFKIILIIVGIIGT